MNKKLAMALASIVGLYTVGAVISKATVVPCMKRMLKYGESSSCDNVEDCSTDEVDPSVN